MLRTLYRLFAKESEKNPISLLEIKGLVEELDEATLVNVIVQIGKIMPPDKYQSKKPHEKLLEYIASFARCLHVPELQEALGQYEVLYGRQGRERHYINFTIRGGLSDGTSLSDRFRFYYSIEKD